ncbi:FadR/GntR family transcriptional regulator [Microbacterium sp.]|uniref:FadR/GntR family transcriptional regulator n=1 Tax=Microbacterium sp. TaxID=51671 RepID=UPI003A8A8E49
MSHPTAPSPRAWRAVLERIEADLLSGLVAPGDRLPPERELAATLQVGRSSVREALRVLEVMGLIRTGTGSGPTSGAIVVATPHGGMAQLLRLQVAAQGFSIADVVQTRLVLERWAAGELASDRVRTDRGLGAVREMLATMAADLPVDDFLALDARFHLALVEAAGNAVITAAMAGLRTAIEEYVRSGSRRLSDWRATATRLIAEHAGIVAAIEDGDADLARTLVNDHITDYYAAAGFGGA